jgi:hypothetical protein
MGKPTGGSNGRGEFSPPTGCYITQIEFIIARILN